MLEFLSRPLGLGLSAASDIKLSSWLWVKTNATILGVFGASPILEPILLGIGMFTGGTGF